MDFCIVTEIALNSYEQGNENGGRQKCRPNFNDLYLQNDERVIYDCFGINIFCHPDI